MKPAGIILGCALLLVACDRKNDVPAVTTTVPSAAPSAPQTAGFVRRPKVERPEGAATAEQLRARVTAALAAIADAKGKTDPVAALEKKKIMYMPAEPGSIVPDTAQAGTITTSSSSALGRAMEQLARPKPPIPASKIGAVFYVEP